MNGKDTIPITLEEALHLDRRQNIANHRRHLNPRITGLLEIIGLDQPFVRASGPYCWDRDGNRYLDFVCGFGALSLGHNHPRLCDAIHQVETLPNLLEAVGPLAGALAHNLSAIAPGGLERVFFANSGAEVVGAAIKLARAATGRVELVSCQGGFHGRTIGALSLMDRPEYREPFLPLLEDVSFVPFGDIEALDRKLGGRNVAGFIVEPIQGEGGMLEPPSGYLKSVKDLCSYYGTLLVVDEVQTGMGRTGAMFAVNHHAVVPDVLLLGKALGGGVMPLSALLTTDDLWKSSKGNTSRSPFFASTYGGNTRACAAGLATLEVIINERLSTHAAKLGACLIDRLRELQRRQQLINDVRGRGLMVGIEFAQATRGLASVATGGVLNRLSKKYLAGLILIQLFRRHGIMTMMTANNLNVLRVQPPLNIEEQQLDYFVNSLEETLQEIGSFSRAALKSWHIILKAHFA